MKKLFVTFTAMAFALSMVSCDDLNWGGDEEVQGSTDPTVTVQTSYYYGDVTVAQDGEVTYQTGDKMVAATTDSDASTISITMKEMKFAENMPLSLNIMFSDVEPSTIGDYYYAATITPTATDGEPITYVEITRLVIVTMDEELMVKFDCTMYGTTTYSVTFLTENITDEGQGDEELTDEEEDIVPSTPTGTEYVGEMNVTKDGVVSYTDSAAVLYATIDETKECVDVTLSGVKFSAYMPITLDLTFSDVAYDAASGSYYVASTTPTDADGAEMTSVAISDFTFTHVSEEVISVSFICTYGGSDYTITFTNDEEEDSDNNDEDTSIDTVLRSFEGVIEVEKDNAVVYTDSATAVNYTKSAEEVNVVLPSVKFSEYMPVTIYMAINNVEYRDDLGHYYINETVAIDADGEELSSVVIREFMLYEENSYTVAISFICNYNGTDYEISYNAQLKSDTVDPDPVYYGAMSVSNGYNDDNAYAIVLSNADSTARVILEEVKFSAYMPVTIYMDFQDIALNDSGVYYAETITPLDRYDEAVDGVSVSNFSLTYVTENYVSISFTCTYGGADYTIAFEGSNI
ncbi:MAG: hypothetical protein SNH63_04845 [Rikenellaceae bacterium]